MSIPLVSIGRLARLVDSRAFELIILPTEKCNFRCTYCYEDFAVGRMKPETIESVKALIRKRAGDLDTLSISWFGGEPLLAKDIVLDVSTFAAQLARGYPSLSYRGTMTTNGHLLNAATFAELAEAGVRDYQISLDGPQEIHDRTRVMANGKGTFERIWENLLAIKQTSFEVKITLRLHFDAETAFTIEPLLEGIRRDFLDDPRFFVLFKAIERLGGPADEKIKLLDEEDKRQVLAGLRRKLYGEAEPLSAGVEDYVCYASRPNSLMIRADGRIGKCTVALNDDRNTIGRLRPDGTLELDQSRIRPWLRGLETMDPEILGCPLAGLP